MVTTESGIMIVMSDLQDAKAPSSIDTTKSGITTLLISDQAKASSPMAVKESGMVTGGARKEGRRIWDENLIGGEDCAVGPMGGRSCSSLLTYRARNTDTVRKIVFRVKAHCWKYK